MQAPEQVLGWCEVTSKMTNNTQADALAIINDYSHWSKPRILSRLTKMITALLMQRCKFRKKNPNKKIVLGDQRYQYALSKPKGLGLAHVEDYRTDQLIDDIQFLNQRLPPV